MSDWQQERARLAQRIAALRERGICYSCHDLATGELFGAQPVIYQDDEFRVVLDLYPRMKGHTIVVYKPHREDISELAEDEAARLFTLCLRVIRAIKRGLGAEKVYLNTMCDGGINHLHVQLFPRYPGDPIGSKRFVAERGPLIDGAATAACIRAALCADTLQRQDTP